MQHGAQQEPPPPAAPRPQQNVIDPNLVHKNVIEMFPELDLTEFIQRFGHATSEQLASLIIDRMAQIPKKRGTKRRATENIDDDHPAENTLEESYASIENDEDLGDLLIDKFLATLIRKIKSELRQLDQNGADAGFDYFYKHNKRNFIMNQFCGVRVPFIDQMLNLFDYSLVPTSIACFFAENNFSNKLQKMIPDLTQNFWIKSGPPLLIKRKQIMPPFPAELEDFPQNIGTEFGRYIQLMHNYREGEYAELLTEDLKLTQQFNQIRWERPGPEEKIECLVCYEQFPLRRMTYCSAPKVPQHAFLANQSASVDKENRSAPKMDQPGTSNAAAILEEELETSIIDIGEEENTDPSTHPFCRDCIRGQAQAATEQQPLAEGGVGLCCMVPNCKNPILYSDIRSILSKEICKKLDERIAQENVAKALLSNLERCKRCNYAVQMEVDKKVNKVFHCFQCNAEFCRICENDWNDEHFGISCKELEQKLQRERKDRNLEKQLNEAIIRKCPSCGVAFMKDQGCNKMTCRCGMTMCYICRAQKIDYTHFCQHLRDPGNPNWKCKDCSKTCFLYEDAVKKDEQLMAKIRQEAVDEETNAQQSTSKFQHIQKYPPSPYPQAMLRRMNSQ